jgi:hypothetical protein
VKSEFVKTIRHTTTLYYYDGPQVFEARDAIGGHYVGVMIQPVEGKERYVIAGVEPERLRQFRIGTLDLRALLLERPESSWFLASPAVTRESPLALEPQTSALESFSDLPDSGFFLHDYATESATVSEARARNNLVVEIAVEPPEAAAEHRIRVSTLTALLSHVQTLVKHAYGWALRDLSLETRRNIDRSEAHLLDVVVPASAGSFRVMLEASRGPDLVGHTELGRALQRIDELFAHVRDPEQTLATVKLHRGHLAGAYLRLLRFLVETKTGLHYSWAEPAFAVSRWHGIAEREAGPLVEMLSSVSNLGSEPVELIGSLKKADVDQGSWRLSVGEDDISGKIKSGGPSLAGLKLESRYRFCCLEEIEETQGGREQRTLYLIEHQSA